MISAKEEVQHLLKDLPDNVSFEEIQYHIYVCQKIDRGLEEVQSGRIVSEEEFETRMSRWLKP